MPEKRTCHKATDVHNESALQVNFIDSEFDIFVVGQLQETRIVDLPSLLSVEVGSVEDDTAQITGVHLVDELFA